MKATTLQFGDHRIELNVPDSADILSAGAVNPLPDPAREILRSLDEPAGTRPLAELARGRRSAAIVVSDNTRPIPYRDSNGVLLPLLETLERSGVGKIEIIVACGMHRPMEENELRRMLGDAPFEKGVRIINHVGTDASMLRTIGRTLRVPEVTVNRRYLEAELKIATGLVEPHFMAGVSGGRKAICPGICGQDVTYGFHSARILNHEKATSLALEGNPCHEEALEIAKMAGVDFTVNVTIDSDKRLTGVFSGELEEAHRRAVEHLLTYAAIPLKRLYGVVITQAADVGVNHYQCAKAAVEACRAARPGADVIIVGDFRDPDPVGGENYKEMLRLAVRLGPQEFCRRIEDDGWTFVPEQWEVQMWSRAAAHLGASDHIHLCAPRLENCPEDLIPEQNVAARSRSLPGESDVAFAQRILQERVDTVTRRYPEGDVAVLSDGPYAVPVFEPSR